MLSFYSWADGKCVDCTRLRAQGLWEGDWFEIQKSYALILNTNLPRIQVPLFSAQTFLTAQHIMGKAKPSLGALRSEQPFSGHPPTAPSVRNST